MDNIQIENILRINGCVEVILPHQTNEETVENLRSSMAGWFGGATKSPAMVTTMKSEGGMHPQRTTTTAWTITAYCGTSELYSCLSTLMNELFALKKQMEDNTIILHINGQAQEIQL